MRLLDSEGLSADFIYTNNIRSVVICVQTKSYKFYSIINSYFRDDEPAGKVSETSNLKPNKIKQRQ